MSDGISDKKKLKMESVFIKFLVSKIKSVGGSIQLHHITGHLSQLSPEVRNSMGSSKVDIFNFLENHTDIFYVDVDKNIVSLANCNDLKKINYDSDDSSMDHNASLPSKIQKGIGVIVKLFPGFGFIKTKEPVKTSVYFTAYHFGKDCDLNLTECGLNIGTMVYFNAVKERKDNYTSKYRAQKVWKMDKGDESSLICKTRKNRETGLYDPVNLDGEGRIQTVFPLFGFISVIGDAKNTVYFHKNRVTNYDNIVDLSQVFKIGDLVEFSAHRSTKPDAKARWEAAKVWKKSCSSFGIKKQSNDTTCKSDSSSLNNDQSLTKFDPKKKHLSLTVNKKNTAKEMISNHPGKICPRANGSVIKFGENFTELADGDSSVYYSHGVQVVDIGWEFSEGDNVKFDAVKIKSAPGWKAVLVWVGDKPDIVLPTCLGDFSEFTDEDADEILDDSSISSNYLSISSHSSLKSLSMKSESSSGFQSNISCKNSSKLRHYLPSAVKYPENDGFKSPDLHARQFYGSQSRSSSSSKASDSSSEQSQSEKKSRRNGLKENEFNSVFHSKNISESANKKGIASQSKDTVIKGDEYSKYALDINDEKNMPEIGLKSCEFPEESEVNENSKNEGSMNVEVQTGSINKLQDIIGKVTKVYSTIAEVKSSKLSDSISFFWSSFYCDSVSMEDLNLNDLRAILKVGDIVYFNCFEIVDDFGESWKQVSLAWTGKKPKVPELTPDKFIKLNELSVTVKKEVNNVQSEKTDKKFLTSFDDISPDVCDSHTESCSDGIEDDKTLFSSQNSECSQVPETPSASPFKELSDMISQRVLKDKHLFMDAKVDLKSLSSEIIKVVLERFNVTESSDSVIRSSTKENLSQEISTITCSACGKKITEDSSRDVNTKDIDVQTIFTGEVMAQNIYTQC